MSLVHHVRRIPSAIKSAPDTYLRGFIFTLLFPCALGGWVPWIIASDSPPARGFWRLGWVLVLAGILIYLLCLFAFLEAGGTPAIFFTRKLNQVWGEEPRRLVRGRLYNYSRNPMYVAVVTSALGLATVNASLSGLLYVALLFLAFHLTVVLIEEPHLKKRDPQSFAEYQASVPRWLGVPRKSPHL